MTELLISVRSPQEAWAAFQGGAAVIDVKEPCCGSLGRAPDETIAAVIRCVAGRRLVSAAMGELVEGLPSFPGAGLAYLKWGLAGSRGRACWRDELARAIAQMREANPSCRAVAVAYADWHRADAPPPEEVCAFACGHPCGAFLVDTWRKDGTTLLDWLSRSAIDKLRQNCLQRGVRVALAGSLTAVQIRLLRDCEPAWFAVRGAACHGRRREQTIDPLAVRRLADLIRTPFSGAP
jgi:uncharacterized protein (UPF0264 family)